VKATSGREQETERVYSGASMAERTSAIKRYDETVNAKKAGE